jgi:hypothetical protein
MPQYFSPATSDSFRELSWAACGKRRPSFVSYQKFRQLFEALALLQRNPKLTPADIRRILTTSARRLGPGERDENFGSGLIDPLQALQLAEPRTATRTPLRR